jgi:hypothetical protein
MHFETSTEVAQAEFSQRRRKKNSSSDLSFPPKQKKVIVQF